MRHPVIDRITGNTPTASPIHNNNSNNNSNNDSPALYNNSYLEATSISFREGLRPPSSSAGAISRESSGDRRGSWEAEEAPEEIVNNNNVVGDEVSGIKEGKD